MTSQVTNTGPFGRYQRGSAGHVLNALCKHGVPVHIAEEVSFSNGSTLMYCGKEFCKYKYFDGIDQPLFRFQNQAYECQSMIVDPEKRIRQPKFHLGLSVQDTPGLTISGPEASVELHKFIKTECLTNWMDKPGYKLTQESGAFFQGGSEHPDGEWIFIEFWKPEGAQAFVDFINNNYTVSMDTKSA
jgi:hypothetical protein